MRLKYGCLILLFVSSIGLFADFMGTKAMSTGFATEELSEETKSKFVSNIGLSHIITEPEKRAIQCFNVNEKGMIAICQESTHRDAVCIYSSQGAFLYGYSFECAQSFGVEWDDENVNIYFVRSDIIMSLDADGNILDIREIQNTIANDRYKNVILHTTQKTIGVTTYLIRNMMGPLNLIASSYSQVVLTNDTGTEQIIYDVNSDQLIKMIFTLNFISIFIAVGISFFVRTCITIKHGNKGRT